MVAGATKHKYVLLKLLNKGDSERTLNIKWRKNHG